MSLPGAPIEMSLIQPDQDRLDELAQMFYGGTFVQMTPGIKREIYQTALQEQQVSALSVLAKVAVRLVGQT